MAIYNLKNRIPSCDVDVELIKRLEDYLIRNLAQIIAADNQSKRTRYRVVVSDSFGTETFKSISDFSIPLFPDGTNSISISVNHTFEEEEISVTIDFEKDREYSKIKIECCSSNAREKAIAALNGLLNLIVSNRNLNWIFRPPTWIGMIISLISIVLLGLLPALYAAGYLISATIISVYLLIITLLALSSKYIKFYTIFDTRNSRILQKTWNWMALGIISFILFGTIFVIIRNKLLGF